jgi:hypothetical protein
MPVVEERLSLLEVKMQEVGTTLVRMESILGSLLQMVTGVGQRVDKLDQRVERLDQRLQGVELRVHGHDHNYCDRGRLVRDSREARLIRLRSGAVHFRDDDPNLGRPHSFS